MTTQSLRGRITQYMQDNAQSSRGWYCTWWFKFHVETFTTKQIRAELERMRLDGLVESDHGQRNNTKWQLTAKAIAVGQEAV